MQVLLDSSFARPGSAPIWGAKKGEFRDWTISANIPAVSNSVMKIKFFTNKNTTEIEQTQ